MIRKNRLLLSLLLLGLAAIFIYYYLFNPSGKMFFPFCTFKATTGFDCMGCGAQRSLHALLHGNFYDAFKYNALFVILIPFWIKLAFDFIREQILNYPPGKYSINSWRKSGYVVLIVVVLFTIIRNLDFYPYPL